MSDSLTVRLYPGVLTFCLVIALHCLERGCAWKSGGDCLCPGLDYCSGELCKPSMQQMAAGAGEHKLTD